jgi:hypothetical protein
MTIKERNRYTKYSRFLLIGVKALNAIQLYFGFVEKSKTCCTMIFIFLYVLESRERGRTTMQQINLVGLSTVGILCLDKDLVKNAPN